MGNRIGKIYAAEVTNQPLNVINSQSSSIRVEFDKTLYVVVIVKLNAGRSLNVVDYSLKLGETVIPCAAITREDDAFGISSENIFATGSDYARMLFAVDAAAVNVGTDKVQAVLHSNLPGRQDVNLALTNRGDGALTSVEKLPADGTF